MDKPVRLIIGLFTLVMINLGAIGSLGALPTLATMGYASILFYAAAFLLFFLPYALICAELSTTWSCRGGVFTWVREAFGPGIGFAAVWLQWVDNIIWYPSILSYAASILAYCFDPRLANNHYYMFFMVVAIFWICTLINSFGTRLTGLATTIGMMAGVLLPGVLIVLMGAAWWFLGNPSQLHFSWQHLVPTTHVFDNIAFIVGIVISLSGLEMSAVHAEEVKNPAINYPRSIFLAALVVFSISILGSLSIASIVPQSEISLAAGIIQPFTLFFSQYHLAWAVPILAGLITLGAVANASTCLIAPPKALGEVAKQGYIPKFFAKHNRHRVPVAILLLQGGIMTLVSLIIFLMPNINSSYWIFTDLAGQLYLVMYIVLFATGIRLRQTHPHMKRGYKIPGGKYGIWIVGGVGIIGSLGCLMAGFIPPSNLQTGNLFIYESILVGGILIFVITPFIIYKSYQLQKKRRRPIILEI